MRRRPTAGRIRPLPNSAALYGAVDSVYQATAAEDADGLNEAAPALARAWEAVLPKGIPPRMESQMKVDIDALNSAAGGEDWESAQSAALRIAQNELDLRLLYQLVIDVDLARLKLWTRQLPVDVAAEDAGLVLANVAALDRVWERTRHGVESAGAGGRRTAGAAQGRRRRRPARGRPSRGLAEPSSRGIARPLTDSFPAANWSIRV